MDCVPLGENACLQRGGPVRSFIAVDIGEELLPKIVEVQTQITEGKIKFVEPENVHFTLKFLGEITDEKAQDVIKKLKEVCSTFSPFPIHIKGIGAFPSFNYMKVIWIGIESEEFFTLSTLVDSGMGKLGFRQEKNIIPHLTIGRVKAPGNKARFKAQVKALQNIDIGEMTVDTVILKKSELTRKGPIYSNIEEISL